MSSPTKPSQTLYFGYGSNLWQYQMTQRCPNSTYVGIGRLRGWRWIINERGYANVVQQSEDPAALAQPAGLEAHGDSADATVEVAADKVWGLIYTLTPSDEAALDMNEGVPFAYTKEMLSIDFWPGTEGAAVDTARPATQIEMLVYVDRKRTEPAQPRDEYIYRMNRGIKDALVAGLPSTYVDVVMRRFVPAEVGDGAVEAKAKR